MGRVGFWRHFGNNNVFFLRRIYASMRQSFDTSILMKLDQKREKDQRSGLTCAKQKSGSRRGFLRSRVRRYTRKAFTFSWPVNSSLSLVKSLTFSWYCIQRKFGICWVSSDYSNRKRSILRVHHMKSHGKLNTLVLHRLRHIFKRMVNEISIPQQSN